MKSLLEWLVPLCCSHITAFVFFLCYKLVSFCCQFHKPFLNWKKMNIFCLAFRSNTLQMPFRWRHESLSFDHFPSIKEEKKKRKRERAIKMACTQSDQAKPFWEAWNVFDSFCCCWLALMKFLLDCSALMQLH